MQGGCRAVHCSGKARHRAAKLANRTAHAARTPPARPLAITRTVNVAHGAHTHNPAHALLTVYAGVLGFAPACSSTSTVCTSLRLAAANSGLQPPYTGQVGQAMPRSAVTHGHEGADHVTGAVGHAWLRRQLSVS